MRNLIPSTLIALSLILTACEGSDVYRGTWKAINSEGHQSEITFTSNEMTITTEGGDAETWGYTQNSVHIQNGSTTYGINVDNGLMYKILFPIPDNVEKGAIADQNDQVLYIIGRTKYYSYEEVFGLN